MIDIRQGDVIEQLARLKSEGVKVRTCVTSPPYWGLRDYGTAEWRGGDAECGHNPQRADGGDRADRALPLGRGGMYRDVCGKCGAVRVDNQIGLERTPDEYVAKMVQVFRAVRDVLSDDGTLWVNLGDTYHGGGGGNYGSGISVASKHNQHLTNVRNRVEIEGIKPKDLVGIPWRVAFALQADGWYLRSDIIWHKPNPMPESVRDRPTKSHEYIFLLSKSPRYFYDADAVRENAIQPAHSRKASKIDSSRMDAGYDGHRTRVGLSQAKDFDGFRNRRSVWTVTTKPYKGAHFATFPPDLIEPCILAGTSAKGQCPKCGKAWERVVERVTNTAQRNAAGKNNETYQRGRVTPRGHPLGDFHDLGTVSSTFLGWRATCSCNLDPVPDLVLDPFGGSGTTAEVALKHGRRAILIELNQSYVELQKQRLAKYETAHTAPLFEV